VPSLLFTHVVIARKTLNGVSEQTLARFAARARKAAGLDGAVAVLLTGNDEMRRLNRQFRRKNKPTDVLSFPASEVNGNAGDIAISLDIASDNAERFGHPLATELKILMLHGMLHLAGYDHETDKGEMARREHQLRAELKLPDSLIARTGLATSVATARSSATPQSTRRKR
jgi:probable rRNA maturation factor